MQTAHRRRSPRLAEPEFGQWTFRDTRMVGVFLLLTALATAVSVFGRIASGTDQPGLTESLSAIAMNKFLYVLGGAGRLASGITLLVAALYLRGTWLVGRGSSSRFVPILLSLSGLANSLSGGLAIVMAQVASVIVSVGLASDVPRTITTVAGLRSLSGTISFALAGMGLAVGWRNLWRAGGAYRSLAPPTALLGLAMQLIWIDSATVFHRISGGVFLIWLLTIGGMLAQGRSRAWPGRETANLET